MFTIVSTCPHIHHHCLLTNTRLEGAFFSGPRLVLSLYFYFSLGERLLFFQMRPRVSVRDSVRPEVFPSLDFLKILWTNEQSVPEMADM